MEKTPTIPTDPEAITDYDTCYWRTVDILEKDGPSSDKAALWLDRLVVIANTTDSEQSTAAQQKRLSETYFLQGLVQATNGQTNTASQKLMSIATAETDPVAKENLLSERQFLIALSDPGRKSVEGFSRPNPPKYVAREKSRTENDWLLVQHTDAPIATEDTYEQAPPTTPKPGLTRGR